MRSVIANSVCFPWVSDLVVRKVLSLLWTSLVAEWSRTRYVRFLAVRVPRPEVGEGCSEVDGYTRVLGWCEEQWWFSCACYAPGTDKHEALSDEVRSEAEGFQVRVQGDEETWAEGGRQRPHGHRRYGTR